MSRDQYITAIETELKHWPGVSYEWDRSRKHRKVHLKFNGAERWNVVPSTASDNVRGHKNNVTQMRKMLLDMGAKRREGVPTSKREQQEEAANMATGAPIRIGISDTVTIIIPKTSDLYERFANDKDQPKGHWSVELRSNPDLKAEPFIAIVPRKIPAGKKRINGAVGGSFNKATHGFQLTFSLGTSGLVATRFGKFRSVAADVTKNNGEIHLKLPADRQPVILRGEKRMEALTAPPPPPIVEEVVPMPEAPIAHGIVGVDALAKLLDGMKVPDRMMLQLPERPLTVERCVSFLNSRVKSKTPRNLRLTVDSESGLISYIEKGGPAY